ncbi:MAG: hypothetical protein WBA93_10630 [Microcoleaceae cyanobacterium]
MLKKLVALIFTAVIYVSAFPEFANATPLINISSINLSFGEQLMTIVVRNLAFQTEEEDIREIFNFYGQVEKVSLPISRETGKKRSFAFVEMETESEEEEAIKQVNIEVHKTNAKESKPSDRGNFYRGRY